ncbi:protein of unknown function [Methylacidimicrobium sp. AP8]|nr:protein of unknown function [Methylacidimicrobium sp. AP8]
MRRDRIGGRLRLAPCSDSGGGGSPLSVPSSSRYFAGELAEDLSGVPQVIVARLKAANGITYYEFVDWDPNPPRTGLGGTIAYVFA